MFNKIFNRDIKGKLHFLIEVIELFKIFFLLKSFFKKPCERDVKVMKLSAIFYAVLHTLMNLTVTCFSHIKCIVVKISPGFVEM